MEPAQLEELTRLRIANIILEWTDDYKQLRGIKKFWLGNPPNNSFSESFPKRSQDDKSGTSNNGDQETKLCNTSDANTSQEPMKPSPSKKPKNGVESTWNEWKLEDDNSDLEEAAKNARDDWESCLDKDVTASGSRKSSRWSGGLLGATATSNEAFSAKTESQPESQASETTVPESQQSCYKPTGERIKTIGDSLAGKTICEALQYLYTNRGKVDYKNKSVLRETEHTHFVVNRLLDLVFGSMKALVSKKNDNFSPVTGLREEIELHFYMETMHSKQKSDRFPDNAFYLSGKEKNSTKFTEEDATVGILVTFEQKSDLNNNAMLKEAHKEICRDFAKKLDPLNVFAPTVGYGVITDGIDWFFLRMEPIITATGVELETFASNRITIWNPAGQSTGTKDPANFAELAKWLSFIVHKSIIERTTEPRLLGKISRSLAFPNNPFTITEFVGMGRFIVVKGSFSANDEKAVLKLPEGRSSAERVERLAVERKNLLIFKDCESIVNVLPNYEECLDFLALQDSGIALDKLIVGGEAGRKLAKVVKNDIWETALKALRGKQFVHADIHPGNICIKQGENGIFRATLVDFEGAVRKGNMLADSPILNRDKLVEAGFVKRNEGADFRVDKAAVAALLLCLWKDGSFSDLIRHTIEFGQLMKNVDFVPDIIAEI